ncbi:HD-GYP domain-containing protein [Pseudorhodoferax sp.]|uniref:HD-GYP domain-containing protein n=1 Tax=Pseudorhodoferax sp. TaxID=1993553 RepID=UPI002DD69DE0|nr:two-component system response regulator [Pseudorhodoferax sp.]
MPKPTVLVVDDEPLNLAVMSELLSPNYRMLGARSGPIALDLLKHELPDLILLDVMMPDMDGYSVLAAVRGDPRTASLPVIFVTALGAEVDEERGLALGASDYIVKPVKPAVVLARVNTQYELKQARDRLADQNVWLEKELARRLHESEVAQDLTLCALAEMAETRDNETGNHILRTQAYVESLARHLQHHPELAADLEESQLVRIVKAAPMHDIGKIGIRDEILLKPGSLTPAEFVTMKTHAQLGADALERSINKALALHAEHGRPGDPEPEAVRFLRVARTIANYHHERWDGTGYPEALKGDQIPIAARLMALADVYDALTTVRVYKAAWTHEAAVEHILRQSGTHFDPRLVAAFQDLSTQFQAIARRLAD